MCWWCVESHGENCYVQLQQMGKVECVEVN